VVSHRTGYLIFSDGAVNVCDHQLVPGGEEEHPEGQLQPQPFSHIFPCKLGLCYTVARWQKFLPENSNVAEEKKLGGRKRWWQKFGRISPKVAEKWQQKIVTNGHSSFAADW
jgi:hypothetical protein